jgi:uncharacterized protein YbaA (DUF1428 family)
MPTIDGFLLPIPIAHPSAYERLESEWWPQFEALGATGLVVSWGDRMPGGTQTGFREAVQARPEESVVFLWTSWPDPQTRDRALERMRLFGSSLPFDANRMVRAGFRQAEGAPG